MKKNVRKMFVDFVKVYAENKAKEDVVNGRFAINDYDEMLDEFEEDFSEELEEMLQLYSEKYYDYYCEEYKLPKDEVIDKLLLDYDEEDDDIEVAISDYLSDKYDYCIYSFLYEEKENVVEVKNIHWDIGE